MDPRYPNDPAGWNSPTQPLPPYAPRAGSASRPTGVRSRPVAPQHLPPLPPLPEAPSRRRVGPPMPPRRRVPRVLRLLLVALLLLGVTLGMVTLGRVYAFGRAISTQAPFSTQTGYVSGTARVNVLVMGYGGAGHQGATLTDSLLVLSVIPATGSTTLISVPRDLWVQVPPASGRYAKINTAYTDGLVNGFANLPPGVAAGGAEATRKVGEVLGMDIPYWVTIDFAGFRTLVDALGGVEITVPTAFTAQYPANDNPAINASWKTINFTTGPQHMNGERAIEYARARYVLTPLSEGTDFARSARQQLLVRAIVSRARQVSAWPGLSAGMDALQQAVRTNLSLADLALFAQKLDLAKAAHVGLTNSNVLVGAQSSDGQAILLPQGGDWAAIPRYVAANLRP